MAAHSRRTSRCSRPGIITPLLIAVLAVWLCAFQAQAQALPPTLVTKLKDAVVLVEVTLTTPDGEIGASGSGFIISPDGQLITNAHVVAMTSEDEMGGVVVATAREVTVVFHPATPQEQSFPAEVLRENHDVDLALLTIKQPTPTYLGFVNSDDVVETSRIWVCGHPLGLREFSIREGTVTAHRTWEGSQYIEHDASAEEGNSGGPVVIADGSVTGVHVMTLISTGMLTKFAIPSNVVTTWLATDPATDPPPPIPGRAIRALLANSDLAYTQEGAGTFVITPRGGLPVNAHEYDDFLRVYVNLGELPGENPYLQGCAALAALRFNYEDPVGRLSVWDKDGTYELYWEAQVPMSAANTGYLATLTAAGSRQAVRWGQFMSLEELAEVSDLYPGGDEAKLTTRLEKQIKATGLKYEKKEDKYFQLPYEGDVSVFASIFQGLVYIRSYTGGMPGANLRQQGQNAIGALKRNWDDPLGRLALDGDNDLVWEAQVPAAFITPDYFAILAATCSSQLADFWEAYGHVDLNG